MRFNKILLLLLLGTGLMFYLDIIDGNLLLCARAKFKYINKELSCGDSLIVKKHGYAELKGKLQDFINSKTGQKEILEASIYFRDLENGPTLGINEHSKFTPASLLKTPVMVAYLRLAEENPGFLEKKIRIRALKEEDPYKPYITGTQSIELDKFYTISEIIESMIKYSDNTAYYALTLYLNQIYPKIDYLKETLNDLGILEPEDSEQEVLTVKEYSSIFIQLYNASFLSDKKSSEFALKLLEESEFSEGLKAGLPVNIKVAHKFGERTSLNGIKQLHDCGIIYYPKNPYLLCVMTRGGDFSKLPGIISEISKMVYEEFDSRRL